MKPGPWEFEKRAKQALYQFNLAESEHEPVCERQPPSQEKDDSIFDKHFYGSEKEVTPQSEQEGYCSNIEVPNSISITKESPFPALSNSALFEQKDWADPTSVFKLKQSHFKDTSA